MPTVTRFPPSPTGDLHLGGARTALFNWLYAKQSGGELILRIEDTDRERSSEQAVANIMEGLRWLGLDWQQGPFYQTQRSDRYTQVIQQLLAAGHAYHCDCTKQRLEISRERQRAAGEKPRYDRHCRERGIVPSDATPTVVRFKNPLDGAVVFHDSVRGEVRIDNRELDDLVIARADGSPTYNLCVVVDDMDMGITHVIRGDDHINNTPRQLNILNALGAKPPNYAHLPMIAGADGARLSKRHGAESVLAYRDLGILPEALRNYLLRLGWAHGDQEIFSADEMVELFDLAKVQKSPANFDMAKLLWLNAHYLREADPKILGKELGARLTARGLDCAAGPSLSAAAEVFAARVSSLAEMADAVGYLYAEVEEYQPKAAKQHLRRDTAQLLGVLRTELARVADWNRHELAQCMQRVMDAHGVKLGALAQPLRVAVSGSAATPSIEITLELVGKTRTLARIDKAVAWIEQNAS